MLYELDSIDFFDVASLRSGDCRELLKELEDCSVDSIVTDPPYELGFMGMSWDRQGIAYDINVWRECLRVLKPGGHLLAFGGARTYHRLACAIEDAGFEIRDQIMWIYGSGVPKAQDVSKAIDKAAGAKRTEIVGVKPGHEKFVNRTNAHLASSGKSQGWDRPWKADPEAVARSHMVFAPVTDAARQWQGWCTALKPAHEPIAVARKPLEGTVAENILKWGAGAFNIDGCRVARNESTARKSEVRALNIEGCRVASNENTDMESEVIVRRVYGSIRKKRFRYDGDSDRWPANVIHDGDDEVIALFPKSKAGSAARFFYCAKASNKDRGEYNNHPTVKPTELMRYLCRLVTPPGGLILDPFMGSGSTGKAAILEGFRFIGFDLIGDYLNIASKRLLEAMELRSEAA